MRRNAVVITAALLAASFVAGACSDDSDDSSSSVAGDETRTVDRSTTGSEVDSAASTESSDDEVATGLERARSEAAKYSETPTDLGAFSGATPLPTVPGPGRRLGFVECPLPTCSIVGDGVEEAIAAVGWEFVPVTYQAADPSTIAGAIQQLLDQDVDYIALTGGEPFEYYAELLEEAKAQGVEVLDSFSAHEVDPDGTGIYSCVGCVPFYGALISSLTNWIIADSGGNAHVITLNLGGLTLLETFNPTVESTLADNCPTCTIDLVEVTATEFGAGAAPGKVVAAVEAAPGESYLLVAFGDLGGGVVDALETAGLADKVTIVVADANTSDISNLEAGRVAAVTGNATFVGGYALVDAALRLDQDVWDQATLTEVLPFQIWTPDDESIEPMVDFGPQFRQLWGIE